MKLPSRVAWYQGIETRNALPKKEMGTKEADAFRGRMQLAVITRANSHTHRRRWGSIELSTASSTRYATRCYHVHNQAIFIIARRRSCRSKCELFDNGQTTESTIYVERATSFCRSRPIVYARLCFNMSRYRNVRDDPTNVIPAVRHVSRANTSINVEFTPVTTPCTLVPHCLTLQLNAFSVES